MQWQIPKESRVRLRRKVSCIPLTRSLKWLAGVCAVAYAILSSALWEVWSWVDWIGFSAGIALVLGLSVAARSVFRSKTLVLSGAPITRKYPQGMTTAFFVCGLWLFSFVSPTVRPTSGTILAPLPLTLVFLAICILNFGRIFTQWKLYRYRTLIPFTTCIVVGVLGWEVRGPVDNALFWHWRLPGYEATIQKMESGTISVSALERQLSSAEYDNRLALNAWAVRDENGSLIVTFLYGDTGAVGLHDAFVYCESGKLSVKDESSWRWKRRLSGKWFQVES
jgi:hypothetical protein